MALLLPNSIFIHVPKTGGTWVRSVLELNNMAESEILCSCHVDSVASNSVNPQRHIHNGMHKGIRDIPTELQKGRLLFGFVRHPLSWYQSYWVYRKIQGWSVDDVRNGHHITESFTHFVESRLHHRPCGVSIMYRTKFGSKKSDNIFIGKMENLRQNLCTALDMAGEDYGAGIINTKEKTNVASSNDEWKEKCYYTPELLEKVLETEEEAINRFGYSNTDL